MARRRALTGAVIDASVAVKWVVAEENSEAALRLLRGDAALMAPAHWLAEAATGLWAACRRDELTESQAYERVGVLAAAPVATEPLENLAAAAMGLAFRLGLTIYDTLYLALAEREGARLITADRRLFETARRDRQSRARVSWLGD